MTKLHVKSAILIVSMTTFAPFKRWGVMLFHESQVLKQDGVAATPPKDTQWMTNAVGC